MKRVFRFFIDYSSFLTEMNKQACLKQNDWLGLYVKWFTLKFSFVGIIARNFR